MKKENIKLDSLTLIGLTTRTNNKNEFNPDRAKIGALVADYWNQQTANKFKDRVNPGTTYSVYTDYESDEHGDYTYFIGEEVKTLDNQDLTKFKTLTIPASSYQKFTTARGKMPDVVIAAWQEIWQVNFDGQRTYSADLEMYGKQASDLSNAIVDIYIGVK